LRDGRGQVNGYAQSGGSEDGGFGGARFLKRKSRRCALNWRGWGEGGGEGYAFGERNVWPFPLMGGTQKSTATKKGQDE